MKDVEHGFIQTDGKLYDDLREQVEKFVKDVKEFVKENIEKIV